MSTMPGWYNQPDGSQRYWNGQAWTEHVRPIPNSSPMPLAGVGVEALPGVTSTRAPLYTNKIFLGAAAVALVAVTLVLFGGGQQQVEAPMAMPAPTVTVTETAAAAPTVPVTETAASPPTTAVPEQAASEPVPPISTKPEEAEPETFKMPKLVGKNLQDAQDQLQALGSYLMDQEDASGLGRFQLLDANWRVCSQKPAAGKLVSIDTVIVLASVKLTERCP